MCCFLRCRPFVRAPLRDAVLVGFSSRSFPAHVGRGVTFILPRFSPNPSALRTGFHLFRQPFSFQFFFFFRLRVFFVIAVQWYRGTQNRFECVNKFKVTKKEIERRLFLSHLGSRFPPPSRAPASCSAILIVPDRTPRAIQRLGLKSMQQHGIRRSFPCSVSFNESVCEIAISLSAVLAATCSARERMRDRARYAEAGALHETHDVLFG